MRKTHEPQAALKALIAAVGVSTMVMASAPAHAGPLGFIKKAAEKELNKAAEARLQAEAERSGVAKLIQAGTTVATASEVQAPSEPQAGDEHEIAFDIAAGALKLVQNGTTVETAGEIQAGGQSTQQVGRGRARARAEVGSSALAADAEPQDAFMYFGPQAQMGWDNVKNIKSPAVAGEATDKDHKDWIIIQSLSQAEFRGGVFVASGDVNGDGRDDIIVGPGMCKLVQNGTTVETASEILSNLSDEEETLWSLAKRSHSMPASCAKLVQNGTTVATASEIQAQHEEEGILVGLLLPAVQQFRPTARPARAGMSQNGTTVPTADTVTAKPERTNFAVLIEGKGSSEGETSGTSQNGTTVPTADTVQAPRDPQKGLTGYLEIGDIPGESQSSATGGAGGAGKVKFDRLSIKK